MGESMIKVLLVDDEERLLQNLSFFFEDEGYHIFVAGSGEEALEILRQEDIAACVVDMRLPGIDGNEVIRTALTEGLLEKFIIHTGSTDYLLPADLQDQGMTTNHIFLKPVAEMNVLAEAVETLLKGKL